MTLLIVGLAVFFGVHFLPAFPTARARMHQRLGDAPYRSLFALVALAGLVLIILGKARAPYVPWYEPPTWGRYAAMPLVLVAFVLLPAANMPGNVKRFTRHPMLWGVSLWAIAHLLANGDAASVLLFGAFLVYSLIDMVSANARGAQLSTLHQPWRKDAMVVAAGIIAFGVFLWLHPILFGRAVLA